MCTLKCVYTYIFIVLQKFSCAFSCTKLFFHIALCVCPCVWDVYKRQAECSPIWIFLHQSASGLPFFAVPFFHFLIINPPCCLLSYHLPLPTIKMNWLINKEMCIRDRCRIYLEKTEALLIMCSCALRAFCVLLVSISISF